MKMVRLLFTAKLIVAWLVCSLSKAGEPAPSIESVLDQWEKTSKQCQVLDAKLTVLRYNAFHGDGNPEIMQGRFYYEAPSFARYQTREGRAAKDGGLPSIREDVVWTSDGVYCVHHRDKTCEFWPAKLTATARQELEKKPTRTCWDRFLAFGLALASGPEYHLPLVVNVDAQRPRFNFQVRRRDGRIVLEAKPKQSDSVFEEIDLMLDADSYRLLAHQSVLSAPSDRIVHLFDDVKLNRFPPDRDTLTTPVPTGYKLLQFGDDSRTLFGRTLDFPLPRR